MDSRGGTGVGCEREVDASIRVFDLGGDAEAAAARQRLQKVAQDVLERGAKRREAVLQTSGRTDPVFRPQDDAQVPPGGVNQVSLFDLCQSA